MKTYREAMEMASAHLTTGAETQNRAEFARAAEILDTVLETWPDNPQAMVLLGMAVAELGHQGTSLALLCYAVKLAPDMPEAWHNLGTTLRRCGHTDPSRAALAKGLELRPDDARAYGNLAGTYVNCGDPLPGVEFGKRALAIDPDEANAANNLALCLLELGRWHEAWQHYPKRHRHRLAYARSYAAPQWDGRPVDSLLIHGEQGLGDEVMFLGLVEDVRPLVRGRLVLEVNAKLAPIVRRSFPACEVITAQAEFTGEVAAVTAMGDVPRWFRDGVPPKRAGYLKPDAAKVQKWRDFFGGRPAVLLAWKGGVKATHEMLRNPPRELWAPLIAMGAVWSIQYGEGAADHAKRMGLPHLDMAAADIDEQFACICAADALVTVQQTALHLAAAVGARVFGVIPSAPAWRYGMAGPMPWYTDSVRLFRQAAGEGWEGAVAAATAAVREMRA